MRTGLCARAVADDLEQGKSAGKWQQDDLLPSVGAFAGFVVLAVGANLFLRQDHVHIFGEIHAAVVASPAVALRRAARWRRALVEQRHVAAPAELLRVHVHRLALWAIHVPIMP